MVAWTNVFATDARRIHGIILRSPGKSMEFTGHLKNLSVFPWHSLKPIKNVLPWLQGQMFLPRMHGEYTELYSGLVTNHFDYPGNLKNLSVFPWL